MTYWCKQQQNYPKATRMSSHERKAMNRTIVDFITCIVGFVLGMVTFNEYGWIGIVIMVAYPLYLIYHFVVTDMDDFL